MKPLKKKIKHFIRDLGRTQFALKIISSLAYFYLRIIHKTCKFEVHGAEEFINLCKENAGAIFIAWHGRVLVLPCFFENNCTLKALVSPHQDGQIIAKILRKYNISTINGSTNDHAATAAVKIVKELNSGTTVAIIPDGPRGPRMKLNKSIVYFAQKTGKPIIGFTYSAKNAMVIKKSWDAMLIPRPYTEGIILPTKPFFVPKDLTEEELEAYRQKIENELNEITYKADELCNIERIEPGTGKTKKYQNNSQSTN